MMASSQSFGSLDTNDGKVYTLSQMGAMETGSKMVVVVEDSGHVNHHMQSNRTNNYIVDQPSTSTAQDVVVEQVIELEAGQQVMLEDGTMAIVVVSQTGEHLLAPIIQEQQEPLPKPPRVVWSAFNNSDNAPLETLEVSYSKNIHTRMIPKDPPDVSDNNDGLYDAMDDVDDLGSMAVTSTDDWNQFVPVPQGIKMRRSRIFGSCRCPECGQTFVNMARLERHLSVHQVFGSYMCPLCGKTYKYEYNLFYHWRKTCRDLNELISIDERKTMEVNNLREMVEDMATKRNSEAPFDDDSSFEKVPHEGPPPQRVDLPIARRGSCCPECGLVVLASHLERHVAIHNGRVAVDEKGVSGGYYCDLCGLMFRQHQNLLKHWRLNCPEIKKNVDIDADSLALLEYEQLTKTVEDILNVKQAKEQQLQASNKIMMEGVMSSRLQKTDVIERTHVPLINTGLPLDLEVEDNCNIPPPKIKKSASILTRKKVIIKKQHIQPTAEGQIEEGTDEADPDDIDVTTVEDHPETGDDNEFVTARGSRPYQREISTSHAAIRSNKIDSERDRESDLSFGRAKWSSSGGPVQCPECFRSFANEGRLERHLAGFHASYGTHHCILCGNRFKYDYNLLYHYRHSCPYTKAFLDDEVRKQFDAPTLRRLIRQLAIKEVRLTPHMIPSNESGSGKIGVRYTPTGIASHITKGLTNGHSCPVCSVVFYGRPSVSRHIEAVHPQEWNDLQAAGAVEMDGTVRLEDIEVVEAPADADEETLLKAVQIKRAADARIHNGYGEESTEPYHNEDEYYPEQIVDEEPIVIDTTQAIYANAPREIHSGNINHQTNIDPEIESSVANILTEMRQEAATQVGAFAQEDAAILKKSKLIKLRRVIKPSQRKERMNLDDEVLIRVDDQPVSAAEEILSLELEKALSEEIGQAVVKKIPNKRSGRKTQHQPQAETTVSIHVSHQEESPTVSKRNARSTKQEKISEQLFECSQCNKSFAMKASLVRHATVHNNEKEKNDKDVKKKKTNTKAKQVNINAEESVTKKGGKSGELLSPQRRSSRLSQISGFDLD